MPSIVEPAWARRLTRLDYGTRGSANNSISLPFERQNDSGTRSGQFRLRPDEMSACYGDFALSTTSSERSRTCGSGFVVTVAPHQVVAEGSHARRRAIAEVPGCREAHSCGADVDFMRSPRKAQRRER